MCAELEGGLEDWFERVSNAILAIWYLQQMFIAFFY